MQEIILYKIILNFNQIDLTQFIDDSNLRIALQDALGELGRLKPKNPINFLGKFLTNYKI